MSRPNLLLLHGALGSSSQMSPLVPFLRKNFETHTLEFEGHGNSPLKKRPFRAAHFAENVLAYLGEKSLTKVDIFGYSMGGHIGVYLARHFPERVDRVFTLATKFLWTPDIAAREVAFLDSDKMIEKVPEFAKVLQERHALSGWKNVLEKTKEMFLWQGEKEVLSDQDMRQIPHRVRVAVGDRDIMVNIEEAVHVYRLLPQGELQIFPATVHPLERVSLPGLAHSIIGFFD